MASIAIIIPTFKNVLSDYETYSLKHTMSKLKEGRVIRFAAPIGINVKFYQENYPNIAFDFYEEEYFRSTLDYSRLMLCPDFYKKYIEYEYILIHQTDAIMVKDNLDYWCAQPFDYVGAPWPAGLTVHLNFGRFTSPNDLKLKVHVGNGGFSLRKVNTVISLLEKYSEEVALYIKNGFDEIAGHNEDVFFAAMGLACSNFNIPDQIQASLFATEFPPGYYMQFNGDNPPMAGHAWWKFDMQFWTDLINKSE